MEPAPSPERVYFTTLSPLSRSVWSCETKSRRKKKKRQVESKHWAQIMIHWKHRGRAVRETVSGAELSKMTELHRTNSCSCNHLQTLKSQGKKWRDGRVSERLRLMRGNLGRITDILWGAVTATLTTAHFYQEQTTADYLSPCVVKIRDQDVNLLPPSFSQQFVEPRWQNHFSHFLFLNTVIQLQTNAIISNGNVTESECSGKVVSVSPYLTISSDH